jgi:hypothetical protein
MLGIDPISRSGRSIGVCFILAWFSWCGNAEAQWYDSNWLYSKAITINGGLCGAVPCIAGAQTNFPVLVSLPSDADLAARAQNDGDDILFTASDGITKLDHEIEAFDGATGALVAWVRVPSLPAGVNTTIYLYYGNSSASDQQNVAGVWGASFRGVWHLKEDPSISQMMDSTPNANHGSPLGGMTSSDQVPGQIGGALNFDGSDDGINAGSDPSLDDLGPLTISAWIWPTHVPGTAGKIVAKVDSAVPNGRYFFELDDTAPEDDALEFTKGHATTDLKVDSINGTVLYTGWQHVVLTWDGSSAAGNVHIYRNGVEVAYQSATSGVGTMGSEAGASLFIGMRDNGTELFTGLIDEVRISSVVQPVSTIQTEYNNHANQGVGVGRFILSLSQETTSVELLSFEAVSLASAVELTWETASEIDNLGFHLYRSKDGDGPFERITHQLIPGLGSSPAGANYRYVDSGLENGSTYYYQLEDIETNGTTERHGPVSATPNENAPSSGEDVSAPRVTFGDPLAGHFVVNRHRNTVVIELESRGFYAGLREDGTVSIEIPDHVTTNMEGEPSLPVRRSWVDVLAGRKVTLTSVERFDEEIINGLIPSSPGRPRLQANRTTVRASRRRRVGRNDRQFSSYPPEPARLLEVGYQGRSKKALIEMAPLRWDRGKLVLTRRMVVRLSLAGRDPDDRNAAKVPTQRNRNLRRHRSKSTVAHLATRDQGLHMVRLKDVFGRMQRRPPLERIRLSRQGRSVPFHLEDGNLYFLSEGAEANLYGNEAVYELHVGTPGIPMSIRSATPGDGLISYYRQSIEQEQDHLYYPTLLHATDRWLWKTFFAPARESFAFTVSELAPSSEPSRLVVWLQGASDFPTDSDHHIRAWVNGSLVGEMNWDGEKPALIDVEFSSGVLHEGENTLEIENVGDTEAAHSMVLLDRFRIVYPRITRSVAGRLEGMWPASGTTEITGVGDGSVVIDTTQDPVWLEDTQSDGDTVRFRVEGGNEYLIVDRDELLEPEIRRPKLGKLVRRNNKADWLAIGPSTMLGTVKPLLDLRRDEGLRVEAVALEDVFSKFGFGETTPEAIRDFLIFAYHHWTVPPRFVLLIGDATYDFKDRLGTGVVNQVPPLLVDTSYLETVSDPVLAAVNGDDSLPDLAIGRLPASDVGELKAMIDKIVAFEISGRSMGDRVVLIADDPDEGGNFEANVQELSSTVLSAHEVEKIFLGQRGAAATRGAIQLAFDNGTSLMSYIGHGGIHLWADEKVFSIDDIQYLSPQTEQPFLLTMNCLNGYFHFPYFDSLSESLLKVEGKGVVAALSPSGLSLNDAAHIYHKLLLEEITGGGHKRLGDALLEGQGRYAETGMFPDAILVYHLFGDPALNLR